MNDLLPHDLLLGLAAMANIFGDLRDYMRDFLAWIESGVGNWGVAIILLTIIVRIVIFPLTWKQIRSQLAMQSLQPKIKELQKKYKGDKQKLQQETMRLYQEYRINPFASCMPLLLQMPIFILLYYSIRNFPAMAGAEFLWFQLDQKDPYYILLVIYVVSQLVSTELMLTPDTMAQQKWMMRGMPLIFVAFLYSFPSGLFVYWITTNLWTVGQTLIIRYLRVHRPVELKPADTSGRKESRFMRAMAAAQDQQQPTRTEARAAGERSQGKKGARPAGQRAKAGAKPQAKPGAKPQGKPGAKPGGGAQAKAGSKPQAKPGAKPQGKPGAPNAQGKTGPASPGKAGGGQKTKPAGRPARPSGEPRNAPPKSGEA